MDILQIDHLKKRFGALTVIDDLNLCVPKNAVFGFLGKNGAGKTTTMKMIVGLMKPDSGTIQINGNTVRFGNASTNRQIGFLPDVPEFYGYMKPKEYLRLCGRLCGMSDKKISEKSDELLALVGLDGINRRISGFSRGMKQRLGIAQALIGDPVLLLCDEPTSALDPVGRKEILDILKNIKDRTTIVFSTHILADVDRICDSIGILNNGHLAVEGAIENIKEKYAGEGFAVQINEVDALETVRGELLKTGSVKAANIVNGILEVKASDAVSAGKEIVSILAVHRLSLLKFEMMEPDLEQVFMEVIGQ